MRINVLSCTSEHIYIYMVFMRVNVKQKKKIKQVITLSVGR